MDHPILELLVLTDDELQEARRRVREMAYFKWQNAGCPEGPSYAAKFWQEAELEWVEYYYVPHRGCEPECDQVRDPDAYVYRPRQPR